MMLTEKWLFLFCPMSTSMWRTRRTWRKMFISMAMQGTWGHLLKSLRRMQGRVLTSLTSFFSFLLRIIQTFSLQPLVSVLVPPRLKFSPKEEIRKRKLIQIAEADTKGLLTDETCEEGSVSKSEHKAAIPSPESSALNTIECSSCPLKFGNKSY